MLITLTTDFGYRDPFVGIMKGVIAAINPQARVIDLSHGIAPQDVMAAALILRHAVGYFPPGSIHVVVVDPGVGSSRRPLLIEGPGRFFIGPDNGVLTLALDKTTAGPAVHLTNAAYHRQPVSATFHGRDIFAPVAAHLSLGVAPASFGDPVGDTVRLAWPEVTNSGRSVTGEIIYIDRFGNLFTNIQLEQLPVAWARDHLLISCASTVIRGLAPNYAVVSEGEALALINSFGLLEIAIYKDNARGRLGAKLGDKVMVSAG